MADSSKFETIITEKVGGAFQIRLNRPEARNAFSRMMDAEFEEALRQARDDQDVRVVTVRGNGDLFSSGHDLKEIAEDYASNYSAKARSEYVPALDSLWYFPKPIIAAVHGFVGPGAFLMLGYVDFVLAEEGTRFSMESMRLGARLPDGNPLVFHFPPKVWKKIMMLGGWLDEQQALKYDLVQRVVAKGQLDQELDRWTRNICLLPPEQIIATKAAIRREYELMGLAVIALVHDRPRDIESRTPEKKAWFELVRRVGLREALRQRDDGFDDDVMQV
jgi:enoyl-CoA hydratase